ncbi:MAG TPA: 23S rRNA (uracil(1939)-C(5))-methyltransferase RlmD [archaeon]|nr:23S rRNA (uracil(1939)-C(5))-methyltransferase RlmD [archaeon]
MGQDYRAVLQQYKAAEQEPECAHQKEECNGCPLMPLPYEKQLEMKGRMLREIFGREIEVEPAPSRLGYRNRIDLSYINGKLGYREKGNVRESFELKKCLLVSDSLNEKIQSVSEMLRGSGIESADIMRRKSGLGYAVFRESRKNDWMVNFVFFGESDAKINAICEKIAKDGAAGACVMVNETWSDTSSGKIVQLFGEGKLAEDILGKKFLIGPETFFQTNVESAQKIFSIVRENVPAGSVVLDLYCGVGTISLCIAEKCGRVVGIELSRESINSAAENAELNGVRNAYFACGSAEEKLKEVGGFDVIIADPPRQGLTRKTILAIMEQNPKKIIYISCNPQTLAEDLKWISGYSVSYLKAFDQFAQTPHMEMLCILEREAAL